MPAKKSNVRKSTSKSNGFKFRWWMGVGLVAVVALVGVLVLRFSRAGTSYTDYVTSHFTYPLPTRDLALNLRNTGHWDCYDNNCQQFRGSTRACAHISYQGYIDYNLTRAPLTVNTGVTILETGSGPSASYSCPSYK